MRNPLKYNTRKELFLITMALPSIAGVMLFFILPFAVSLHMALIDNPLGRNFVGLEHFTRTLDNAAFRLGLRNTLLFMVFSVPVNMAFSLLAAMLLQSVKRTTGVILSMLLLLPLVVPSGSLVHFWRSVFGVNGFINNLFFSYEPVRWLNSDYSLWVIVFIFIWKNVGINIVLFLAGINMIPKDYYEYAMIEGAGSFRRFKSITLTYLIPTFFMAFLMSIVMSFRAFREIFLLTGAHPHRSIYMLQHYMNNMFAALNYQRLAAASYIMTAGLVVIVLILFYIQRRVLNYD